MENLLLLGVPILKHITVPLFFIFDHENEEVQNANPISLLFTKGGGHKFTDFACF